MSLNLPKKILKFLSMIIKKNFRFIGCLPPNKIDQGLVYCLVWSILGHTTFPKGETMCLKEIITGMKWLNHLQLE